MSAPDRIWARPTERQPMPSRQRALGAWLRGAWKDHDSKAHGDVAYLREDGPTITAYREALRKMGLDPDSIAREAEKEAQNG